VTIGTPRLALATLRSATVADMARPLREDDYDGAMHHIILRGVARSAVAVDAEDYDRTMFFLEHTAERFELGFLAWSLLPNHFHLLITSKASKRSDAMQWFGTNVAQSFNQRHNRVGHLFQGRFTSKLVEKESYLRELARYVPLNPVLAGLCRRPEAWPWSSYAASAGLRTPPWFLEDENLVGVVGSRDDYVRWVTESAEPTTLDGIGAPRPAPRPPLTVLLADGLDSSLAAAYYDHGYGTSELAAFLGKSRWHVGRRLARFRRP
jgi:REP element-mobilizing transposase RayT